MARTAHRAGFSLAEVLAACAILLVLAGMLYVVSGAAKVRGKLITDVSNLRSLGVAGGLYASDYDDIQPLSVKPILESGYASEDIVVSKLDPTDKGVVHVFVSSLALSNRDKLLPRVKTSYLGPGDGGWSMDHFRRNSNDATEVGWLVSLVRCDPGRSGTYKVATGPYQRLLMDGSVQSKHSSFGNLLVEGFLETRVITFRDYFMDHSHK